MINLFKEKDKEEKEPKKDLTIFDIILNFTNFSIAIILMTLFYMGALSTQGGMSDEDYEANVTAVFDILGDTLSSVVITFYEHGKENPRVFTFIFFVTIAFWFYNLGRDIYQYIKQKKKKEKIKLDGAVQVLGDVASAIT